MSLSAHTRTNIFGFFGIVFLSSVTMLWLFWRFPITTAIATVLVWAVLGVSARLARSMDTEKMADLERS